MIPALTLWFLVSLFFQIFLLYSYGGHTKGGLYKSWIQYFLDDLIVWFIESSVKPRQNYWNQKMKVEKRG